MGINNSISLESASLSTIICADEIFIHNLEDKAHRTALFVFNLDPDEDDISDTGAKEIRKQSIPPEKIQCALIPERFRTAIEHSGEEYGIPKEKIIYVNDVKHSIHLSYKDENQGIPSCETPNPINIPDFGTHLRSVMSDTENKPIYIHATRLPE